MQPIRVQRGAITGGSGSVENTSARGRYADLGPERIEKAVYGRAQDAYNAIMALMSAMVQAIMKDPNLTHDQKRAAVRMLKQEKKLEAKAIRRRIIQDEKDKLKGGKRKGRSGKAPPLPPAPTIH